MCHLASFADDLTILHTLSKKGDIEKQMFDSISLFEEQFNRQCGFTTFNDNLAVKYGVTRAIVIQKVHYAVRTTRDFESEYGSDTHYEDGRWWVEKSYTGWHKLMPYIDIRTVKRVFSAMREDGILLSISRFEIDGANAKMWWAVNYEKIFSDMKGEGVVAKCHHQGGAKMSPAYNNIYNIYIERRKEYKDKEYKESTHVDQSTVLGFLGTLGDSDQTLLYSFLTIEFKRIYSLEGRPHPKLPDTPQTAEMLRVLLGIIHERGLDGATNDLERFFNAKWIKGDKHLWLFCSEKVQAWLRAEETGDYDDWALATDRVVF